jgi:hypothetical protein
MSFFIQTDFLADARVLKIEVRFCNKESSQKFANSIDNYIKYLAIQQKISKYKLEDNKNTENNYRERTIQELSKKRKRFLMMVAKRPRHPGFDSGFARSKFSGKDLPKAKLCFGLRPNQRLGL